MQINVDKIFSLRILIDELRHWSKESCHNLRTVPIHRFIYAKGIPSCSYFLQPMHTPNPLPPVHFHTIIGQNAWMHEQITKEVEGRRSMHLYECTHSYGNHRGSLFCTGIKFDELKSCALNSIPAQKSEPLWLPYILGMFTNLWITK